MQITVTIPDEIAATATARGQTPESFVERLVADQVASLQSFQPVNELTAEEFNAALDELTRYSEKIPSLPIEAFSRETFYEGHD